MDNEIEICSYKKSDISDSSIHENGLVDICPFSNCFFVVPSFQ